MKKAALVAVVLAAAVCATPGWGQGRSSKQGGPGGNMMMSCPAMALMPIQAGMVDKCAETLQLTDDQTSKLKEVLTTADTTAKTLTQKTANATKALREALVATEFDAQKVKDLASAAEKAEAALVSARIDEWTQIRAILTADQVKTLQQSMTPQRPSQGQSQGQSQGEKPAGPPPGGEGFPPPGGDGMQPPPGE